MKLNEITDNHMLIIGLFLSLLALFTWLWFEHMDYKKVKRHAMKQNRLNTKYSKIYRVRNN